MGSTMSAKEKLKEILERGEDWKKYPTSVPGIFILKIPSYKSSPPKLKVEVNPVNTFGQPLKKRGILINDLDELNVIRNLINSAKLSEIIKTVEEINPKSNKNQPIIEF